MNIERPRWASERSGSVRAKQHQHVGPGGEGAPGLDAVDQPAPLGRGGRGDDAGDVGAEVGLGHRHRGQHLGRGQFGQPLLLLRFGAAVDEGPGEDLGPGDQRAADAERAPAQLLGGDHHAHVVALAAGGEAVVLLGDREAEAAELGQAADDLLGDVAVGPVDVLGVGADLVLGEAVERLADQLEVAPQVPRALDVGQRGQGGRVATGGQEVGRRGAPSRLDAPGRLPPRHPTDQVGQDIGHEGRGQALFGLAQGAVGERGARGGDGRRGVRHVVGHDLVGVDAAVGAYGGAARVDETLGQLDGLGGRGQARRKWTASWHRPYWLRLGLHDPL